MRHYEQQPIDREKVQGISRAAAGLSFQSLRLRKLLPDFEDGRQEKAPSFDAASSRAVTQHPAACRRTNQEDVSLSSSQTDAPYAMDGYQPITPVASLHCAPLSRHSHALYVSSTTPRYFPGLPGALRIVSRMLEYHPSCSCRLPWVFRAASVCIVEWRSPHVGNYLVDL